MKSSKSWSQLSIERYSWVVDGTTYVGAADRCGLKLDMEGTGKGGGNR